MRQPNLYPIVCFGDPEVVQSKSTLKFSGDKAALSAHLETRKKIQKTINELSTLMETSTQLKVFAKRSKKSVEEVEKLFNKAKDTAKNAGHKQADESFLPFVIGILKKMLNLD